MANKTATLKVTLAYQPAGGGTAQVVMNPLSVPYQAQVEGTIDVPDQAPQDTVYTIPFGTIGDGATLLLVVNKTGQELKLLVNGGDVENNIPDQDYALIEASKLGASPIVDASVKTTVALQSGDGSVDFFVLGDPA